jgi:hypothetical protein
MSGGNHKMNNTITQCTISACLLTSHFWGEAISVVSVVAQLLATITGAAIGIITLYRMWKHRTMRADLHLYETITQEKHDHTH